MRKRWTKSRYYCEEILPLLNDGRKKKKKGKEKNKEKAQPGAVEIHGTATAPLI